MEEVRRLRLAMLVEEFGSYAELNAMTDMNRRDSSLSQIAGQSINSKGGSGKAMGSPMARKLEAACEKPRGWMDTDPELWPFENVDPDRVHALKPRERDMLEGALLSVAIQLGLQVNRVVA